MRKIELLKNDTRADAVECLNLVIKQINSEINVQGIVVIVNEQDPVDPSRERNHVFGNRISRATKLWMLENAKLYILGVE